ncbi:MAG TPA: hydroxyisourate hydrolase [Thermoanaerobaculia bacterium]|nr:hydroxyisourate hydrolase [Thermoanaerobaculia bacterium]
MSTITTHVLDTARGVPARGVPVLLQRREGSELVDVGRGQTDDDGRLGDLVSGSAVPGVYRLVFGIEDYFSALGEEAFFPEVTVEFRHDDRRRHTHVPLLLSPFGYATYRGS